MTKAAVAEIIVVKVVAAKSFFFGVWQERGRGEVVYAFSPVLADVSAAKVVVADLVTAELVAAKHILSAVVEAKLFAAVTVAVRRGDQLCGVCQYGGKACGNPVVAGVVLTNAVGGRGRVCNGSC